MTHPAKRGLEESKKLCDAGHIEDKTLDVVLCLFYSLQHYIKTAIGSYWNDESINRVTDNTQAIYLKRAYNFFKNFGLLRDDITLQEICEALIRSATDRSNTLGSADYNTQPVHTKTIGYSKSYWYQLKTTIVNILYMLGMDDAGQVVSALRPDIKSNEFYKPQRKNKRIRSSDFCKIEDEILDMPANKQARYENLVRIIVIIYFTGVRPIEILRMSIDEKNNRVGIISAKKTIAMRNSIESPNQFDRGIDRHFMLPQETIEVLSKALKYLRQSGFLPEHSTIVTTTIENDFRKKITNENKRFSRLTKKLFGPKRRLCLTSLRHQFCSVNRTGFIGG